MFNRYSRTCKDMFSFQQPQINEFVLQPFLPLLLFFFTLWFFKKQIYKNSSKNRQPPSPPRLPILGNLHQLSTLTHRSFRSLSTKYGPIMLLHLGRKPVIIVQSADGAREIMKTHDLIFADRPHTKTSRRLFYDLRDITTAPYGEYWRNLKSICTLQLFSSKRVQSFGFIREEETALLMKKIGSSCNLPLNLSEWFDSLANDVICRAAFGRKYSEGEDGKKFLMLLRELTHLFGSVSIGEFVPFLGWINRVNGFNNGLEKVANELDDFLERVLQEHLNEGLETGGAVKDESRENFVDILLNNYKDDSIDRTSIKAIILDILFGGTDTASATLEWTMTELLRHPFVLKKLQMEVREVLQDKQIITNEDLGEMQYLRATVNETLRLHPPVPFTGRVTREDVRIMGYDIAAGTMVLINIWAIGMDPASWDEPDKFLPERFLNSSVDFKGLDFEFIPFGAGRRGCPGIGFAMASVELVLANLMHKFDWELPAGTKGKDLDTTEQPGVTLHLKHPLFAVAIHH